MMRLIDADALIQDLKEHKIPFNADINEAIIVSPTIDAEPVRHGKWKHTGSHWKYDYRCSECDFQIRGEIPEEYRFCPNCGAKMDEVSE